MTQEQAFNTLDKATQPNVVPHLTRGDYVNIHTALTVISLALQENAALKKQVEQLNKPTETDKPAKTDAATQE